MDVFRAREQRLNELARVESALVRLENSVPDVPGSVWVEHARLAVRRHQLAMGVAMDREAKAAERRAEGGGRCGS